MVPTVVRRDTNKLDWGTRGSECARARPYGRGRSGGHLYIVYGRRNHPRRGLGATDSTVTLLRVACIAERVFKDFLSAICYAVADADTNAAAAAAAYILQKQRCRCPRPGRIFVRRIEKKNVFSSPYPGAILSKKKNKVFTSPDPGAFLSRKKKSLFLPVPGRTTRKERNDSDFFFGLQNIATLTPSKSLSSFWISHAPIR